VFGALVMVITFPFDVSQGNRWMPVIDAAGVAAFMSVPLLNRLGHVLMSRVILTILCNLLALANAVVLGVASGSDLLFLALAAVPFAIFDMRERWILFGLALPVVGFAVTELGLLNQFARIPPGYSARIYHAYSAAVALGILLYASYQVCRANARAEQALRLDIAARERAERALAQTRQASITAAKMAALGEMSANVAHEVNNPLAAILLKAERLHKLASQGRLDVAGVARMAREITGTVERIRRIIDALRSVARQGETDPVRPEPVLTIVSDTVELSAQRYRMSGIDLMVDPISPALLVDCRAAQVSQILMNLLSNAHDAVDRTPNPWVKIGVEEQDDDVRIVVTDSGRGIPPEIASRIMEPFFTTKAIGRGTGLGLSVSKGIAEAQGGRLELDTRSARTRFVLTLKRSAPLAPEPLPPERPGLHR
jgi:signal transduction histidine kinase